jgi:hypothetical protein
MKKARPTGRDARLKPTSRRPVLPFADFRERFSIRKPRNKNLCRSDSVPTNPPRRVFKRALRLRRQVRPNRVFQFFVEF